MVEAERRGSGVQGDLEKELTCSICTDLLFQPLTLLDCLHTFCGACLKEWFSFQASTATSIHPYTCPSCRASVRTTQPNAAVTTLLDIFLKANPHKGKTDEEKHADREKFKPGDVVLPKLRRRDERDDADRRLLEDVQQLSLREAGIPGGNSSTLGLPRERRGDRSRDRSRDSRRSRTQGASPSRSPRGSSPSRVVIPPRAVGHQSSLISLLSASELDSDDVDEGLVRQVLEELVEEGIDLNQIGPTQEDEITERLAEAVRRRQAERHAERQRERRERRDRIAREGLTSSSSSSLAQPLRSPLRDEEGARRRVHARSESGTSTPQTAPGPPISRPGLMDAANRGGRSHHTRSSSQGSSRSARRAERPAALSLSNTPGASDTERPSTSENAVAPRRRQSDNQQRNRLDARQQFRNSIQTAMSNPNSPRSLNFNIPTSDSPTSSIPVSQSTSTPAATPFPAPPSSRRTTDPTRGGQPRPSNGTPPTASTPTFPRSTTDPNANESRTRLPLAPAPVVLKYEEPHISCQSCGKDHIEYELHYNCDKCDEGSYNICLRCFRAAKGCKHWFGFGWTAWHNYERKAPEGGYPPDHEPPHILIGQRYRRPSTPVTESTAPPHKLMSEDDPAQRFESGVFCDICKALANVCYWKCDFCNEGDWGFCNDCVNQGRHCTHPLLPAAHEPTESPEPIPHIEPTPSAPPTPRLDATLAPPDHDSAPSTPPLTPSSASLMGGPDTFVIANTTFRPLTFTTLCNVCRYPIPPSHTRYHCLKCNGGDYDICMNCYHKLNVSNRISKEDGINGWRKCLRGHRMVIVGFEDRDGGQRRKVVRELVGGYALKEEESSNPGSHQTQRFPPEGGVGLRLLATWRYWPDEGDKDELAFPRVAEIREARDLNGDWYWGVYCGAEGLFPANHVTAV
ncbi:hypothetical protein IQ07DRAFT_513987 [Pyrenochaeta sp. DS3sAY3a]|nr:hypothetical protein IQ07DRAFT_513987 [Pyrenochaeta sp. DS3sAY3a]